jgi:NitT/TauT family transport system permease protein/taurine transport system permease protein
MRRQPVLLTRQNAHETLLKHLRRISLRIGRRTALGTLTLAILMLAWSAATSGFALISPGRFPSPPDVWMSLWQLVLTGYANGQLHVHVVHSVKLVALGFVVAVGTGVPLGLLMGWSRRAEAVVNPVFLLIRPIPPLAWIPLAILWLGLGDAAKIMVIWFAAFVPAVINSLTGVRMIEPYVIEAAHMLGTRRGRFVREVLVPAAAPMIFTGLRLSLQASWTTLVAAELVGALYGLGRVLNVAQQDIYPGMIFVGMACVAILGWTTTRLLTTIEARTLPWVQLART